MSAFSLKCIAFFLMILDHTYFYIVGTPMWFTYIGRIVAPIYFFLLVESFFHTSDRKKFTMRLLISSGVTFLVLNVMFKQPMNIFLSMFLGVLMLNIIEMIKKSSNNYMRIFLFIPLFMVILISLYTEASYLGVLMICIFYFFHDKKLLKYVLYACISLMDVPFILGSPNAMYELFVTNYQWMMVFSIIPMILYNGKSGYKSRFFKYFFYIAYPVHIIILLILGNTLNPSWYSF